MVVLHVNGRVVSWAEGERVFAEAVRKEKIEFRDETGAVIATASPPAEDPDWVKAITPEETARRMAGPFFTLEEYRAMGEQP